MLDAVNVVVGNREEVEVAVGTAEPHEAAKRLLDRGVDLALVKMGGEGVLVATPDEATVIRSLPVNVVCGLSVGPHPCGHPGLLRAATRQEARHPADGPPDAGCLRGL